MDHEELYKLAVQAIDNLFSDTSVSQEKTAESLKALKEHIDMSLESLEV